MTYCRKKVRSSKVKEVSSWQGRALGPFPEQSFWPLLFLSTWELKCINNLKHVYLLNFFISVEPGTISSPNAFTFTKSICWRTKYSVWITFKMVRFQIRDYFSIKWKLCHIYGSGSVTITYWLRYDQNQGMYDLVKKQTSETTLVVYVIQW